VSLKTTVRTNILVQNYGGGKLVGKATVAKPFKILSGGTYRLGPADAQVVTISYTPSAGLLDSNVVKFTGAAGGLVPVVGKPVNSTEQR
jgi:hypothetical protein